MTTSALARALGFEPDAKLLIVHADDVGLSTSVTRATRLALEQGTVTSASVMLPCRGAGDVEWPEISRRFDIGIHLTVTSEYHACRWGPIAPPAKVPSLVGADGCFRSTVAAFARSARRGEVATELRAQIDRAIRLGLRPTHLDVHMFALYHDHELCRLLKETADAYRLPWLAVRAVDDAERRFPFPWRETDIVLDRVIMATPDIACDDLECWYVAALTALPPGLTQLIVHPGIVDPELSRITDGHVAYGARWRQRDFEAVSSTAFVRALESHDIHLVNWAQVQRAAHLAPQRA